VVLDIFARHDNDKETSVRKAHHPLARAIAGSVLVAAAGAAHAQAASSVRIYGVLDAGVENNKSGAPGESDVWRLNTGNQLASRLGFSATEDLGGGLSALANIELGLFVDDGTIVQYGEPRGTYWGRRSVVGLKHVKLGEVVAGRDYTPAFWTVIQTDRFRYGLPGTVSTPSNLIVSRSNKTVFYTSPNWGGVTLRLAMGAADPAVPRGGYQAGSVDFRQGPVFLSAAMQKRKEPAGANTGVEEWGAGGELTFQPFVVSFGTWNADPDTVVANAVTKSTAYWLGAGWTFGVSLLNVQVARTNVDVVGRPARGQATTIGIGYTYSLSKSTALYAGAGRVSNDSNARLPLNTGSQRTGGVVFGADPRAVVVGFRNSF
jgi:predicted porin